MGVTLVNLSDLYTTTNSMNKLKFALTESRWNLPQPW
jgi:hypothetical protein